MFSNTSGFADEAPACAGSNRFDARAHRCCSGERRRLDRVAAHDVKDRHSCIEAGLDVVDVGAEVVLIFDEIRDRAAEAADGFARTAVDGDQAHLAGHARVDAQAVGVALRELHLAIERGDVRDLRDVAVERIGVQPQ